MRIKITFILILQGLITFSQQSMGDVNSQLDIPTVRDIMRNTSINTITNYDTTIKGSPFIQKDYESVKISKLDKRTFPTMYNAYRDFMEISIDGLTQYLLPSKKLPYEIVFLSKEKTYKAFSFKNKKENEYGFFKIATKNKISNLLVRERITLKKAVKPNTSYGEYAPSNFKREKDTYFINFKNNNIAIKLSKKRKSFFKAFSSHSKNIREFVKKEKLTIKKEKDLAKIITYYNTLL
jgi:hypothetical protein